jgi:hypothetical protein
MMLDDAVKEITALIAAASPAAAVTMARISDEEARISVDAAAGDMDAVREAVRDRTIQIMVSEGLDVQVAVYDKDAPKGAVADA